MFNILLSEGLKFSDINEQNVHFDSHDREATVME